MKNGWLIILVFAIVSCLWIAGCEKHNSVEPATNTDQEAMSQLVAADGFFAAENSVLDEGNPSTSLQKSAAVLVPRAWGIKVTSFNRDVNFNTLTDTTAEATVVNTIVGYLWIYPQDTTKPLVQKNFTEVTTRNVKFVRVLRNKDPKNNWKISEISALQGGTINGGITITNITFFIDGDTIAISKPLEYFFKVEERKGPHGLHYMEPSLSDSFKVRVTVVSADPDSDIVVAHRPIMYKNYGGYRRGSMDLISSVPNGDNTYTRIYENTWRGAYSGKHHVMVNAITRQSIFDDAAPLSSQIWGIPFIVE
jgi:hypothetical protein